MIELFQIIQEGEPIFDFPPPGALIINKPILSCRHTIYRCMRSEMMRLNKNLSIKLTVKIPGKIQFPIANMLSEIN